MKSTMKPFRKAVKDVLSGNITYAGSIVPVYDAKVWTSAQPAIYILLATQREQDVTDQDCAWNHRSSIDLQFIAKSDSEVSKDVIDDISDRALELLLSSPGVSNLAVQTGFQILEVKMESAVIGEVQISPTQSELQKIVSLTAFIFHQ